MRRNSPGTSLETTVRSVFEAHTPLGAHALEIKAELGEGLAGWVVGGAGGFVGGDVGFEDGSR